MEQIIADTTMRYSVRDDRVLPAVRIVAVGVIAILLAATWSLYLHPDDTSKYFAWTIKTRMMAMSVGAGYLMGAYFFARLLLRARWHEVAAGFLPITAFTVSMAAITILHADRFQWNLFPAQLWAPVYAVTPFLLPILWWRNQQTDPGAPTPDDILVPRWMRTSALLVGLLLLLAALVYFVAPAGLIAIWPWALDQLAARAIAGWTLIPAVGAVVLSREPRWSSWRILVEAVVVVSVFFLVAVPFSWNDWAPANPLKLLLLIGTGATGASALLGLLYFKRKRRV